MARLRVKKRVCNNNGKEKGREESSQLVGFWHLASSGEEANSHLMTTSCMLLLRSTGYKRALPFGGLRFGGLFGGPIFTSSSIDHTTHFPYLEQLKYI